MPTPDGFTDIDNQPHVCYHCKRPTGFVSMTWCWWEVDEELKAVEICDTCLDDPNMSFYVVPNPELLTDSETVLEMSER